MTKTERLNMIRKVARKIDLERKSKFAMDSATNTRTRKRVSSKLDKFIDSIDESDNINAWTDSSSFADAHYGDAYRETTKFDNDWN